MRRQWREKRTCFKAAARFAGMKCRETALPQRGQARRAALRRRKLYIPCFRLRRKRAHDAAPPFPTANTMLVCGGDPVFSIKYKKCGLKAVGEKRKLPPHKGRQLRSSKRYSLALGELGSTMSGLQTVLLLLANPKTLVYQGFSASLSEFNPYFNPLQTQSNLVRLVDRTLCSQQPKVVRVYYT